MGMEYGSGYELYLDVTLDCNLHLKRQDVYYYRSQCREYEQRLWCQIDVVADIDGLT